MDFKNTNADRTTETQNLVELDAPTENIYESVVIISKRADQINDQMREELHDKLEEFATSTETLEEIFDNKEQIEVSKFYENLPKPTAIAAKEWKEGKIYYRHTDEEKEEQTSED
jgi:DNA-directed RNA polymerase subunit K/omega